MSTAYEVLKNGNFFTTAVEAEGEDGAEALIKELSDLWDASSPTERRQLFRDGQEMMLGGGISASLSTASPASEVAGGRAIGLFLVGAGLVCMGLALM